MDGITFTEVNWDYEACRWLCRIRKNSATYLGKGNSKNQAKVNAYRLYQQVNSY